MSRSAQHRPVEHPAGTHLRSLDERPTAPDCTSIERVTTTRAYNASSPRTPLNLGEGIRITTRMYRMHPRSGRIQRDCSHSFRRPIADLRVERLRRHGCCSSAGRSLRRSRCWLLDRFCLLFLPSSPGRGRRLRIRPHRNRPGGMRPGDGLRRRGSGSPAVITGSILMEGNGGIIRRIDIILSRIGITIRGGSGMIGGGTSFRSIRNGERAHCTVERVTRCQSWNSTSSNLSTS